MHANEEGHNNRTRVMTTPSKTKPLPAAGEPYRQLKRAAFGRAFGDFAAVWRAP